MDRIRINALQQAVQQHLAEHGGRNWKLVQSRFPEVPHATFWRVVKAVRKASNLPAAVTSADRPDISFISYLPPSYEPVKKLKEFQEQLEHANDLIAQSKGLNGAIKNWQMHAKGVSLRDTALCRQADMIEKLFDADNMALFINLTLDTLAAVDPSVRNEALAQLRALNERDKEQLYQELRKARDDLEKSGPRIPH